MVKRERDWTYTIWPALCGAWLLGFGVAETLAWRADDVTQPSRKTLSRALERWLGVRPHRRHCRAVEASLVLGALALIVHIEALKPLVDSLVQSESER